MKSFSEKIREASEEAGISQSVLADMCDLSTRSVTAYETGHAKPRGTTLRKLASSLDVTVDYLLNDSCDDRHSESKSSELIDIARAEFGSKGAREMTALLDENRALFAGGAVSEEDKDAFFMALMTAYLACKEDSKRRFGRVEGGGSSV